MASIKDAGFIALITGCNSGLGLATCQRLINEYLTLHPSSTIGLIISTRSPAKSSDTIQQLYRYVSSNGLPVNQVVLEHVEMDLTDLDSVAAVPSLLKELDVPRIDSLILNAGITGFKGIQWPRAIFLVLTDPIAATTFPDYNDSYVGQLLQAKKQPDEDKKTIKEHDLRLGQVFTANVFGHYLLSHVLSEWLYAGYPGGLESGASADSAGRIIWISSIEAEAAADEFTVEDMQGLAATAPYHISKRLVDLLALSASFPETKQYVDDFLPSPSPKTQKGKANQLIRHPTIHVTHPGIMGTNIVPLHPILRMAMVLAFYLALVLGSPWHGIATYAGAVSVVWLSLTTTKTLAGSEQGMPRKWGSGRKLWETEVARWTSVKGYYNGRKDRTVPTDPAGQAKIAPVSDAETRHFKEQAIAVWKEMERLRIAWMKQQ